jgi:hypothetical protein
MKKIIVFSLIVCLSSCRKDENKGIHNEKKMQTDNFSVKIDFPDTVYVNKYYNGQIEYKNILDTITTKVLDVKNPRYIQYAFTITKKINYSEEHLKKIKLDTIYTNSNRFIPLTVILFKELGVNYIDGIITDEVSIENGGKNEKGNPMTRVITHQFRVTHKVVVIEKPKK